MEEIMLKKFAAIILVSTLFTGCASVKMESEEVSLRAKAFNPPAAGSSGLYIFRDSSFGAALKKDLWVDGNCIGETAPNVFFYAEVEGNQNHEIATESEFSPNALSLFTEAGKHYFVRQYLRPGLFVGGAGLAVVPEDEGKAAVSELGLATRGKCSAEK
jgi:hypothetical protein